MSLGGALLTEQMTDRNFTSNRLQQKSLLSRFKYGSDRLKEEGVKAEESPQLFSKLQKKDDLELSFQPVKS